MNPENRKSHGRRQFRPTLSGLENRRLLSTSTATVSTIATLNGSQQAIVGSLVMDGQGNLYGITSAGGNGSGKGIGTVFEIPAGTKKAETLASFDGPRGYGLNGVVMDGQGDLFGSILQEGGAYGAGKVFEIAHGSKTAETVALFDGSNGEFPSALAIDGQGNLYGTSASGYAAGGSKAFEIARGSNAITNLATFNKAGAAPDGVVVDGQGNVFGTNEDGVGRNGGASIYEIARGSNAVTNIAEFDPDYTGVSNLTIDSQGDLFGTTENGGKFDYGTVFEIARGSNTITTLASFNYALNKNTGPSTPDPNVGVVMDAQGNIYGTTEAGGTNGDGTLFEIAHGSNTITTVASFTNIKGSIVSSLLPDGKGNFYGATDGGGSHGAGTVFKLTVK
jgi:uncharacterized repeat protein (TIGR03803 family)